MTGTGSADNREAIHDAILDDCRIIIDQLTTIPANLQDFSRGGARLSLETFVELPSVFPLCLPQEATPRFAHLRWQTGEQFGVHFISEDTFKALQGQTAAERAAPSDSVRGMRQTDHTAALSANDPPDTDLLLPVEYILHFEAASEESSRGRCVIALLIRNDSDIPAIHPFFCLPDLGFQTRPSAGWVARGVTSVRRFTRFCSIRELTLAPHAKVGCCFVELNFSPRDGGVVRYTKDTEHPLAQLPKIRLSCQVGAGNFPSQKLQVNIPASHIAGVILDEMALKIAEGRA